MVAVERKTSVDEVYEIAASCHDCYAIGTNPEDKKKWCAVMGRPIPDPDDIPEWCPCERVD